MAEGVELSVIIPAYNNAEVLPYSLRQLREWFSRYSSPAELIFVNDGSSDGTSALLDAFAKENPFTRVIHLSRNSGKGRAVKEGLARARGDFAVFTDADLSYGTAIFDSMLAHLKAHPKIDFLYGSRKNSFSRELSGYSAFRRIGSALFVRLARLLAAPGVRDTQCGIKMFRSGIVPVLVEKLSVGRFAFDVELFVIVAENGFIHADFPVELLHEKNTSIRFVRDAVRMGVDLFWIALRRFFGLYRAKKAKFPLRRVLFAVFLLLFAAMLLYGFPDSAAPWFDEGINLNLARTLAEKGVFSLQTAPETFVSEKPLLITTGYPALFPVALSFSLLGVGLWQAKMVMLLFLAAFVFLACRLAEKLYGRESTLFVFVLLVTFLPLYGNGKSILGEIPGLVFFLAGLLLVSRERAGPAFFVGVLFGLAAATKSSFLIVLGAVVAGEAYAAFQQGRWNPRRLLYLAAGMSIPLVAWVFTLVPGESVPGLLQNAFEYYRNPYAVHGTVFANLARFFTESTPLHYALLLLAMLAYTLRRGLARLSKEEVNVLVFVLLNLAFYLTTVGWYRYFFPSHLLLLILLPGILLLLFYRAPRIRYVLLSVLSLVQLSVLAVNIRDPLYHSATPRQFGEAANRLVGGDEVVVVDNPEIAFFIERDRKSVV